MSQIGAETSVGNRSRNSMAINASCCLKNPPAFLSCIIHLCGHFCGFRLFLNPLLEFIWRVHVNTEKHLGVLGTAILGTLANINAWFIWIHPHVVFTVGDQVSL